MKTHRLVYVEEYSNAIEAIAREKAVKRMPRCRKQRLVESLNPEWRDLLGDGLFGNGW